VIWVTLESLRDSAVRDLLAASRPLALLIEGAHAASPKAHELRPSLALIPALRSECELRSDREQGHGTSLIAFTRGAPACVREDASARLGLRRASAGSSSALRVVRAPLVPAGTRLRVLSGERKKTDLATLVQRLPRPTAIFCATPHEADAVYAELSSAQVPVHRYHGGMPVSERATEMLHFTLPGRRAVMVATSAFQPGSGLAGIEAGPAATPEGLGLGFVRQKLRSLVHLSTPASLEQYAQELALLGSAEGSTEAVLFFAPESLRKVEEAVFKLRVSDIEVDAVATALSRPGPHTLSALEQTANIGRKATQRVLRLFVDAGLVEHTADGRVTPLVSQGDLAQTVALLAADLEQLRALDGERLNGVVGYVAAEACRTQFLQNGLGGVDDTSSCGACDRCAPEHAERREPGKKPKDASTLVVRRRPAAQAWSVSNPAPRGPLDHNGVDHNGVEHSALDDDASDDLVDDEQDDDLSFSAIQG
jgi:superfamily II DNA helicase RecQ